MSRWRVRESDRHRRPERRRRSLRTPGVSVWSVRSGRREIAEEADDPEESAGVVDLDDLGSVHGDGSVGIRSHA